MEGQMKIALLIFALSLYSTSTAEDCMSLPISNGDVYEEFLNLTELLNDKEDDEVFRYKFAFKLEKKDSLLQIYLSNASTVKELNVADDYWVIQMNDVADKHVAYSALFNKNGTILDNNKRPLKRYDGGEIKFDVVQKKQGRTLAFYQPGVKVPFLNSGAKRFPKFEFMAFQISGEDTDIIYNCFDYFKD